MELSETFIPTAGTVGLLPMLVYYSLIVTSLVFLAQAAFTFTTRPLAEPEHQVSHIISGVIAIVAGYAYFQMQGFYHDMLAELATVADPTDRQTLMRESYPAISQYRYMDWAITTPLLLLTMVRLLNVPLRDVARPIILMLVADLFMIVTGYIGEQQLTFDQEAIVGPKLIWGAVSTVGYVLVPWTLYKLYRQYGASPKLDRTFQLVALTTVTFWGIYPIGYILSAVGVDTNIIHIALCFGDVVNKTGVAALLFLSTHQQKSAQLTPD
ncbi:bacteriorhodopsin [Spirosoma rhododendri]|uniref:Bacteriorhodopsin n=1 Tax=Spirosoma rhododendri TaxID=2728024 RepID=A0A7L5DME3_9BACT|nr:bacteriorhodopsin [Spirosoma rhododendri]QJD77608.1 bacteriorhodopsin [Spirosoma rhododendri]